MTDKEDEENRLEVEWQKGKRWAHLTTISHCLSALGYPDDLKEVAAVVQLELIRAALREACAEYGDNDWDNKLSLVDVLNKHLMNHVRDMGAPRTSSPPHKTFEEALKP